MKSTIPNEKWSLGSPKNCDDVREFLKQREQRLQQEKARELAILLCKHDREAAE